MNRSTQEEYALLIIDMQNDFVLPESPVRVEGALETIPAIRVLLDGFRERRWPVFHIVREYRFDGSDVEIIRLEEFRKRPFAVYGSSGYEIVEALEPLPGEYRIVKSRFSAFMKTELDFILRRLGIARLVVCGTQYPTCVRATIFDAVSYGYWVINITDASSAKSEEIAVSNIRDIRDTGVECMNLETFFRRVHDESL